METTSTSSRRLKPWGSPATMQREPLGRQVDWEKTSDFFSAGKVVVKLAAAVAIGADSITVDPLVKPLRAGEKLTAPDVPTVVVEIAANEAIGQTDLSVLPLPGPLPIGALLDFGTGEQVVKLTAAAAEDAETIVVEALTVALEDGDTATYQGGEHNLEVKEDVDTGETTVPVGNVQYAIADDTELIAQKQGLNYGDKFIPEGTFMVINATNGKMFPRRDADDEEVHGLIASDASNSRLAASDSRSGYGVVIGNTLLYENLLPDADTDGDLPDAYKTELKANTLGFTFRKLTDSRA